MPASTPPELPRVLTRAHATSIVVGIIIGSGIFLVPQEMMAAVGSSTLVYTVWIVGGLLSLFGAMTYAEIAAGRPAYGGEYAFIREAYGDLPGFLYTWTWITIVKPASLATIAAGLARILGTFPALAFFDRPAFGPILWSQLFAIAVTWLITALNIVSTRESANVQLALTWLKALLILVIGGFCFALAFSPAHAVALGAGWRNFTTVFAGARGGLHGFLIALIAALWAYDGWTDVSQMAGEVQNPQRSMPFALIGGIGIVGVLYMLTNAAIQYLLPAAAIAAAARPTVEAMRLAAGAAGAILVSVGIAISMGSTFVGSALSGARVTFAAGRDGLFLRSLAHVHPRFRTPDASLLVQAVLTSLLLLAIGRFQALFSLAIFADWLFYALTASTVFVFRHRDSAIGRPRPFTMPGYPLLPVIFILAAAVLTVFSFIDQPRNSIAGALIILAGIPIHLLLRRRRSIRPAPPAPLLPEP